jgi:hypothetical protein
MTKEEKLNTLYIGAATIGQLEAGAKDEDAGVRDASQILLRAKSDIFDVLRSAYKPEIRYLLEAIELGKIDGSVYQGECACLVGSLEKARDGRYVCTRNSSRPAEKFFMNIHPGDTPEKNAYSKKAQIWIMEYLKESEHA